MPFGVSRSPFSLHFESLQFELTRSSHLLPSTSVDETAPRLPMFPRQLALVDESGSSSGLHEMVAIRNSQNMLLLSILRRDRKEGGSSRLLFFEPFQPLIRFVCSLIDFKPMRSRRSSRRSSFLESSEEPVGPPEPTFPNSSRRRTETSHGSAKRLRTRQLETSRQLRDSSQGVGCSSYIRSSSR